MDKIIIEVLEDGTIKTSTDAVSMPNHANAEAFLREIARLAGGTVARIRKVGSSLRNVLNAHAHDGHTHSH